MRGPAACGDFHRNMCPSLVSFSLVLFLVDLVSGLPLVALQSFSLAGLGASAECHMVTFSPVPNVVRE